ncbi:hypothetical protein CGRA01v4_03765 [Colletotrichum graminicola]|nr:hypothetical protein CGRA01v4_03765 [Colletotrichum graminicola]
MCGFCTRYATYLPRSFLPIHLGRPSWLAPVLPPHLPCKHTNPTHSSPKTVSTHHPPSLSDQPWPSFYRVRPPDPLLCLTPYGYTQHTSLGPVLLLVSLRFHPLSPDPDIFLCWSLPLLQNKALGYASFPPRLLIISRAPAATPAHIRLDCHHVPSIRLLAASLTRTVFAHLQRVPPPPPPPPPAFCLFNYITADHNLFPFYTHARKQYYEVNLHIPFNILGSRSKRLAH